MALSDYLSAIRTLILDSPDGDDPAAAASAAERRAALAARFPALTDDEVRDLAAIPPARIGVYTDLVFAGERGTLQWIFPVTFAVIDRLRREAGDDRPARQAEFALVRALHAHRPWTSPSQRRLASDFQSFILEEQQNWCAAWPGLPDLVDYERSELEAFYAEDVEHEPVTEDGIAALDALSVEAVLALPVFRPAYAAVRAFSHDVLSLVAHFRENDALPATLPGTAAVYAACGRSDATHMTAWVRLAPAMFAAFAALPAGGGPCAINDLAGPFVEARSSEGKADERALFREFFTALLQCLRSGVLLRPTTPGPST